MSGRKNSRLGNRELRKKVRAMIWDRDGYGPAERPGRSWRIDCVICGKKMRRSHFTIEHLLPSAIGGTDDLHNLAAACGDCNNLRPCEPVDDQVRREIVDRTVRFLRRLVEESEISTND